MFKQNYTYKLNIRFSKFIDDGRMVGKWSDNIYVWRTSRSWEYSLCYEHLSKYFIHMLYDTYKVWFLASYISQFILFFHWVVFIKYFAILQILFTSLNVFLFFWFDLRGNEYLSFYSILLFIIMINLSLWPSISS